MRSTLSLVNWEECLKYNISSVNKHVQLTLVVTRWSMGLAKNVPFYNSNIVISGQKDEETQSRNEILDLKMYSIK